MTSLELLRQKRNEILLIAAKHGANEVRVFGSVVRGEDRPDSDIDLLVKRGAKTSAWFPAGMILELEHLLGRRVEVVTDGGLSPYIHDYVLKEALPL